MEYENHDCIGGDGEAPKDWILSKTAHFSFPVLYQTREPLEALAKSGYRRILSRQISGAG